MNKLLRSSTSPGGHGRGASQVVLLSSRLHIKGDVGPCGTKSPEEAPQGAAALPLRHISTAAAEGTVAEAAAAAEEEGSGGASDTGPSFGVLCGVGDLEEHEESLRM
mmetsp:Transcript_110236/g.219015  ORF Transcript_110236/g.219015 Transcript_110236/m.219015 type:complete len:107 (-) Transcript_110236:894-1214(-)